MQPLSNLFEFATAHDLQDRKPDMAILPIGSFEQHGPHLPMETDTLIACSIAKRIQANHNSFILSPITISCSHEHSGFFPSMWLSPNTLLAMINDISDSLEFHGIRKLCIVNGHGGNYVLEHFAQMENMRKNKVLLLPRPSLLNEAVSLAGIEHTPTHDMHAGEYETSVLLADYPQVVRIDALKNNPTERRVLLHLHGLVHYSTCGTVGYPELATAEKGNRVMSELVNLLDPFITEFLALKPEKELTGVYKQSGVEKADFNK